jgi:hypothetical protein
LANAGSRTSTSPARSASPRSSPRRSPLARSRWPATSSSPPAPPASARAHAIWTMSADGGDEKRLTEASWPAWSPDGSRIAFERDGDIWVMNADGSGAVNLTRSPTIDASPDWQRLPAPGADLPPRQFCFEGLRRNIKPGHRPPRDQGCRPGPRRAAPATGGEAVRPGPPDRRTGLGHPAGSPARLGAAPALPGRPNAPPGAALGPRPGDL